MARLPHLDFPGIPQHVVQRGNDRQPCFACDADYEHYRQELGEAALKHGCAIHAYVLMTNHVRVLAMPSAPDGVSRMMQAIGRRYVAGFNARYRRTRTLWEGRFKFALVDSDRYVLARYRYIELNPVRARMVASSVDYPWSSHHANTLAHPEPRVRPHDAWLALGTTPEERRKAYRQLVAAGLTAEELHTLASHTQQQKAWGSERFKCEIETLVGRSMDVHPAGRPRRSGNGTCPLFPMASIKA